MPADIASLESAFSEALEITAGPAREAYLQRACAGDAELRRQVDSLLALHDRAGRFLEAPTASQSHGPVEPTGTTIGPYKLLEVIGEGGMGTVYMAEQTHPVRRKVALKVIKPGMDTRQVIARFEAERQALALMDHPNIARVLDAGATDQGRPFFVMELVKGIPITDYCDREGLPIAARLELFVLVCRAVQHAHQKGIIHRDLKPSNILVTLHDGMPVPKVIDFGIAKATGQSLTEKTIYTGFAQLVGTPLYMSPEQAELSGLDVDTRSDIYSLGVLLYELLTGTTPFDGETLRKAAFDEMRRMIREDQPPTPSTRLGTLGERLTTVSAKRGSDPRRLNRAVRGELDWIAMKALEKDRRRRYETANDFATDVMRYLTCRPVEACPPTARYRLGKYVRRHRVSLTAGALIGLALVAGTGVSTWQAFRARRAELETDKALSIARSSLHKAGEQAAVARGAVDDMYSGFAERWMDRQAKLEPVQRDFLAKALAYYQRFARDNKGDRGAQAALAMAYRRIGRIEGTLGRGDAAEAAYRQAAAVHAALAGAPGDAPGTDFQHEQAHDEMGVAAALRGAGKIDEAIATDHQVLVRLGAIVARSPGREEYLNDQARVHNDLSEAYKAAGRLADALASAHRAVELSRVLVGRSPASQIYRRDMANNLNSLGVLLDDLKRPAESEPILREAVAIQEDLIARGSPAPEDRSDLSGSLHNLGRLAYGRGDKAEAVRLFRRAIEHQKAALRENPRLESAARYLKNHLKDLGLVARERLDHAEAARCAEEWFQTSIGSWRDAVEPGISLVDCARLARRDPALDAASREGVAASYLALAGAMLEEGARRAPGLAEAQDGIAWYLITTDEPALRNPALALRLSRRAVELAPRSVPYQTTLGAALYDSGGWSEAVDILTRALAASRPDEPHAWLYLALAHARLGQAREARHWYDRAAAWAEEHPSKDESLRRLRDEARALIDPGPKPRAPAHATAP